MDNIIFDDFLDDTIEGIIVIEDGFIKNVNSAILGILDYSSKDELIGNLATGILIPNINHKYLEYNNSIFEEISLVTKNGNILPSIMKIKDVNKGEKNCKIVFILNLSDLKEKEELLLEQSRMAAMGEMISMIAHQWKQPLSSISAALSTLKLKINMNKYEPISFENKITDIDKYIDYMSNTIDDFRNFFKSNRKKELISINYIVDISLKMLEKPLRNNNIKIVNSENKLQSIYIYKNELVQVILNILNNSKDAYKENSIKEGIIKIYYKDFSTYQILIIEDDAGGISEDIINKIFNPYFSTKNKKNGTGLGLYMCKTIIEKHCNGEIKAKNKNNGVSFEIKIEK